MQAMVLHHAGEPLQLRTLPDPEPGTGQILIRVEACGVCRTDLHIVDGDLKHPNLPLIPGHEIVGRVMRCDSGVTGFADGMRIGVPWLASTCGRCAFCGAGQENLCDSARFTGYDANGGYAEFCIADARYCFPLPSEPDAAGLAPFLCAGLIGYRSLRLAGEAEHLGIYGFGAAAHLITQLAIFQHRRVYAFTRPGDRAAQEMARELGCAWASGSDEAPPHPLDAAIIFAPVGSLIPAALKSIRKGGTVVCGGIHMSRIPAFDYELLWGERVIRSVANLTRQDAIEFFEIARRARINARITLFPLHQANDALESLRGGKIQGAAVLIP
jgi:alcohol dehydrogenase, propanol-preferring